MGFNFKRDVLRPIKKTFEKPSIILRPLAHPIIEAAEEAAGLSAELLSKVTNPFLGPVDRLLDAVAPRVKFGVSVDIPDPTVTLAGGTYHKLLIPGLNAPSESGTQSPVSDITGGILSDLAFRSEQFRAMREDLSFLQKTMKKGLFPHRNDLFEVVMLVQPNLKANDDPEAMFILTSVRVGDTPPSTIAINLDPQASRVEKEVQVAQLLAGLGRTMTRETINAQLRPQLASRLSPVWQQRMTLAVPRNGVHNLQLSVCFRKLDGTAPTAAQISSAVEALELRVNRVNNDLEETLHRFSITNPKDPDSIKVTFQIDRQEFMTEGSDCFEKNQAVYAVDGGGLKNAADSLEKAIKMIDEFPDSPPSLEKNASQQEIAVGFLLSRIVHAERIRALIWKARVGLKAFRPDEGRFDYRLRYKVAVHNPSLSTTRPIILQMTSKSGSTGKFCPGIFLDNLLLPPQSVYETTVYPVKQSPDMRSSVEIKSTPSVAPLCLVTLSTSYGIGDQIVKSAQLLPVAGATPPPYDTAIMDWEIKDMADYTD